ncbi:MAG: lipoyl synthase [Chitinophagales bacterium]|nr:lipoyl synthase [Chitinophagales bacterium]
MISEPRLRKPDWLKVKIGQGNNFSALSQNIHQKKLHTICESGKCPNKDECWGAGTATIMILGNICTRSCQFCNVDTGKPDEVDIFEPIRVAQSVKEMGAKHIVITSVDRDDLIDGGVGIWAATVRAIRRMVPDITLETLIPDFKGNTDLLDHIVEVNPEVVSHNLETVSRLSREVRVQAQFDRSLKVLKYLKENGINRTKTGVMLGLGETMEEVIELMDQAREAQVDILTLGQYLQPTNKHLKVQEYVSLEKFEELRLIGLSKGFRHVESAPLVRSSYHAEKHIH